MKEWDITELGLGSLWQLSCNCHSLCYPTLCCYPSSPAIWVLGSPVSHTPPTLLNSRLSRREPHCCPQGLSTSCPGPRPLSSHPLWDHCMHVGHSATAQGNPWAALSPHSLKVTFYLLGLSTSTLSNHQTHLPLKKSRLIHFNDLNTLKLVCCCFFKDSVFK